jgi:hypothetical protein
MAMRQQRRTTLIEVVIALGFLAAIVYAVVQFVRHSMWTPFS